MIKYIALYSTAIHNKKVIFNIDTSDNRTGNKLARLKAKEALESTDTIYTRLLELVRVDATGDRIYSDGNGYSYMVIDISH